MTSTNFFVENNIVTIASGVKVIQPKMLPDRQFSCIQIPKSVETIYPNTIFCDVIYDGIFVSKDQIQKYGCENIPRIAILTRYGLDIDKMEKEAFELLPLINDAIKGYKANYSYYRKLHQTLITSPEEDRAFFKICYTMGLFSVPPKTREEVEKAITYIYNYGRFSNWATLKQLQIQDIDITFIQLVLGLYRTDKLFEFMPYYARMYSKCKEICKIIKKIKEQKIYEKKKELEKGFAPGEKEYMLNLVQKLKELELHRKTITFEDIREYFLNHSFVVREGNEALEEIMSIIKSHIYSQGNFDILQDIYEEAKSVKEEASKIYTPLEGQTGEFTYRWLENDAYENLVLGYLTNCCAKLDGAGKDIMKLSMIHPQVRTLVVYDGFHKIIGKSTFFYSLEDKYLLGNTIEVAHSFITSSKTTEKQKETLLQAFLEGLQAQVDAMEKIGYMVEDVRVGMMRNNLKEQLLQYPIEKEKLLPNMRYGNYFGDASSHSQGQAVLPIGRNVKR